MFKNFFRNVILLILNIIETFEYKFQKFDEHSMHNKFLGSKKVNLKTISNKGSVKSNELNITKPYTEWTVEFESGRKLRCADNHLVIDKNGESVTVQHLKVGDVVVSIDGYDIVKKVKKGIFKISMFDLSLDNVGVYYTNEILSHNTVTSAIFITWYLLFHFDRNVLILANKLKTAQEVLDKVKTVLKNLPFFIKSGVVVNNVNSMAFDNGCRVICSSTTKSAAIGFTIHLAYMDEFAHIPKNDLNEFFRSVYPTLSSSKISRLIITSTPNGRNKFYDIYTGAINGENSFCPIRIDWWEVPGRDEEWMQKQLRNFGVEEFNQEFGNQFLSGSRLLLNHNSMRVIERTKTEFVWEEFDELTSLGNDIEPFDYDRLKWHPRYNINKLSSDAFVISVDLSKGKEQDYHVINIFKVVPMQKDKIDKIKYFISESDFFGLLQVGMFRCNKSSIKHISSILYTLVYDIMNSERVKVVVEENVGSGELFSRMETFKGNQNKFEYHNIVHYKHSKVATTVKPGLRLNGENKMMICRKGADYISNGRIVITENITFQEMSTFGLNKKGSGYESQVGHDDIAMSTVNAGTIFEMEDWDILIEDIYDDMPEGFKSFVQKKQSEIGASDDYLSLIGEIA